MELSYKLDAITLFFQQDLVPLFLGLFSRRGPPPQTPVGFSLTMLQTALLPTPKPHRVPGMPTGMS